MVRMSTRTANESARAPRSKIEIQLGCAQLPLRELGKLRASVLLLDRAADDPVDLVVDNRLIARGQLMSMHGHVAVRVTEVLR
jgi:flagellar motor switch protein FliN/FliY